MLRVEIRWIDSGTQYANGWENKDDIVRGASLSEVITVGWLMHEDDFVYYVSTSYDPVNEHFYGTQLIAKSAVTGFTRLRARTLREENDAAEEGDEEGET